MANNRATTSALVIAVSAVPSSAANRATTSATLLIARVIPRRETVPIDPPRIGNTGPRTFGGANTFRRGN